MPNPSQRTYATYIMTNRSYTNLYTGMTGDVSARTYKHKANPTGFAKRYRTSILVYYECTDDVWTAIIREKQIKDMDRADKIALIESLNPSWADLSESLSHEMSLTEG